MRVEDKKDSVIWLGIKNGLAGYKYMMLSLSLLLFFSPVKIKSLAPVHRAFLGGASLFIGLAIACNPFPKLRQRKVTCHEANDKAEQFVVDLAKNKEITGGTHSPSFFASSIDQSQERLGLASLTCVYGI